MKLPYGEWKPDVGGPNSGVATTADGVLPQASATGLGYGPAASLVTATGAEALSGEPKGMISALKADGSYAVIAATETTIEMMDSSYQWSDIESGRTGAGELDTSFAQFGKFVLNTNTVDGFKAYDVDAGGANSAVSAAPAARQVFVTNNLVVACGISTNNRRMQSSAIGDHTNWTTQGADGVTFPDGGALIGGRDMKSGAAVLFQENAIRLMQFTGAGATLYTISKVADGRGAVSDRAIVAFDGMCFFVATDGIYKLTLGGGLEPIGAEKVNRWLAGVVSAADYAKIVAAVDPFQKVVWFQLPNIGKLLGYDWQLNVFFTATVSSTYLSRIATPGISIDSVSDAIDSVGQAIDSRVWSGGGLLFGALDSAYKFATFSGSSLEATLQTCDTALPQSAMVNWCTPDSDAQGSLIYLGVSDNRHTDLTWKEAATKQTSGRVGLRGRGKMFALKEVIPAGAEWTFANGMDDVEVSAGGFR